METHANRAQLIAASLLSEEQWPDHIRSCDECRQAVALLQEFMVAGRVPLPSPPPGWVSRAKALADPKGIKELGRKLVPRLVFDSWALPAAAGVRSAAEGTDRRLYFEIDTVAVDLRVERRGQHWLSVAQLTSDQSEPISLVIDGKPVSQEPSGMIQTSGTHPPKQLILIVGERRIELPEVTWRRRPT